MRQDQIDELEFMLDDHGLEAVLDTIADALERKADYARGCAQRVRASSTIERMESLATRCEAQAQALRAQGQALSAGRALTYATQAPLGV